MNIKRTQTIKTSSSTSNEILSDTKKVFKNIGIDSAAVNEQNLETSIVNSIQQFGCSIQIENKIKISILNKETPEKTAPTVSSFQDEADPFYQTDCGKQSAKRIKQASEKTSKQAEVAIPLLKNIAKQKVKK